MPLCTTRNSESRRSIITTLLNLFLNKWRLIKPRTNAVVTIEWHISLEHLTCFRTIGTVRPLGMAVYGTRFPVCGPAGVSNTNMGFILLLHIQIGALYKCNTIVEYVYFWEYLYIYCSWIRNRKLHNRKTEVKSLKQPYIYVKLTFNLFL